MHPATTSVFFGNLAEVSLISFNALSSPLTVHMFRIITSAILWFSVIISPALFRIPAMISETLLKDYGMVSGRGNTRAKLGPRNAVATGLILSFCSKNGQAQ